MRLQVLGRKVHYWLAIGIAAPILVVIASGILLQLKKQLAWIQPPERQGVGRDPTITFARILEICREIPAAEVRGWEDVNRIDLRPSRGLLKVWAKSNWEIQIDSTTGEVLQVAFRRSDVIEAIHDGSWFHPGAKSWIFLPAGVVLLLLWLTGLYLFWLPILRRRTRSARSRPEPATDQAPS